MEEVDSQLYFIAELINANKPLPGQHLPPLLAALEAKESRPKTATITSLLSISYHTSLKPGEEGGRERQLGVVGEVLRALGGLMSAHQPMSFLVNGQFEDFDKYCQNSSQHSVNTLKMRALGLDPPFKTVKTHPIFSRFDSQQRSGGNIQWMMARYVLSFEFTINRQIMSPQIAQVYLMLLSSQQLCKEWPKNIISRLWALLYCWYTQELLELSLCDCPLPQQYQTWMHKDTEWYKGQLLLLSKHVTRQFESIYYLTMNNVPFLKIERLHSQVSYFGQAYESLSANQTTSWSRVLNLSLFLKIAEAKNELVIVDSIRQIGRKHLDKVVAPSCVPFVPIFFSSQEIIPRVVNGQLHFNRLFLTYRQKKEIAYRKLLENQLNDYWLQLLEQKHFKPLIFSTPQWQNRRFSMSMLGLMANCQDIFVEQLVKLTSREAHTAYDQFCMFFSAWEQYNQLTGPTGSEKPEYRVLNKAAISKKCFLPQFQFLFIPSQCPDATFRILISYKNYFCQRSDKMKKGSSYLQKFHLFQERDLPRLVGVLSEEYSKIFWIQWAEVLKLEQPIQRVLNEVDLTETD